MKRVLAVITTSFSKTGGLSSVMLNYYHFIDKTQVAIDFCSTNECSSELKEELKDNGSSYFKLPKRILIINYWYSLKKMAANYDVIHIHANSQTAAIETTAAKMAGVEKIIVHNHTSRPQYAWIGKLLSPIYHATYTDAVACSRPAGDWIYGVGNYKIIKNAIDVDKFAFSPELRTEYRKALGINDDEFVIGHIGKFMDAKNHPFLIRMFAEYLKLNPKSKLLLVGDGVLRPIVEREITKNKLENSVILTGLRSDIKQLIQVFDVFVFPSIYEGLPLTVLEAQSSGLACIMSSNVTSEVHIADNNYMLDLEKGEAYWAKYIYKLTFKERTQQSLYNREAFTKAGYNIKSEAHVLQNIYLK